MSPQRCYRISFVLLGGLNYLENLRQILMTHNSLPNKSFSTQQLLRLDCLVTWTEYEMKKSAESSLWCGVKIILENMINLLEKEIDVLDSKKPKHGVSIFRKRGKNTNLFGSRTLNETRLK